jgi:hypothetical protein
MMTTKRSRVNYTSIILITVAFLSLTYQQTGFAQYPLRSLQGIVTDQHRVPLKGAVVQVRNEETSGVVSYITGVDGRYSFKRLEGDTDYRVRATDHGHRSKGRNLSIFDSNKVKTINLVISFQ